MVDRNLLKISLSLPLTMLEKCEKLKHFLLALISPLFLPKVLVLPNRNETEDSFIGNAVLKAKAAALTSGMAALADDSGLSVAALNGAPGVYSARWAGPNRDFNIAMTAVERSLLKTQSDDTRAEFICALALVWPDGHAVSVEGKIQGILKFPPRGTRGFGYDPIFQPYGHNISFGEMDPDTKHAISHRADAFAKLISRCFISYHNG